MKRNVRFVYLIWLIALPLGLGLAYCPPAAAATRTVNTLADSGSRSLRSLIELSAPGDTIDFAVSVRGRILLTGGELLVNKPLSFVGPGAGLLAVSGNSTSRVFHVGPQGDVAIYGLTITEGRIIGTNGARGYRDIDGNTSPGSAGEEVHGAGILNEGSLRLYDSMITSNSVVGGNGGRGTNGFVSPEGEESRATQGGAGGGGLGAGIYSVGSLELFRCTILGNTALGGIGGAGGNNPLTIGLGAAGGPGGTGLGAGIVAAAAARLESCTVTGNRATGGSGGAAGSGISFGVGGGGGAGNGGGLSGVLSLSSCTVTDNSVSGGSGGASDMPGALGATVCGGVNVFTLELLNTIIARNTGAPDSPNVIGMVTSLGWNLIGITDGSSGWTTNDFLGDSSFPLNPRIGPCQDNGGSVWTICPLTSSPARDKGKSGLAIDARGGERIVDFPDIPNAPGGDGSDIGALEVDSLFRVLSIVKNDLFTRVIFKSDPGGAYVLEQTRALTNGLWTSVPGTDITGTGQNVEATDPTRLPLRFYRVRRN